MIFFQFSCCLASWYYLTLLILPWLLWPWSLLVLLPVCFLLFLWILLYCLHFLCLIFIYLPRCCPHYSYLFSPFTIIPLAIYSSITALFLMILMYLLPSPISAWMISYITLSYEMFYRYFKEKSHLSSLSTLSLSLPNLSLTLCLHLNPLNGTTFFASTWIRHHQSYPQKLSFSYFFDIANHEEF